MAEARQTAKNAAPALGVKGAKLAVLDALFAYSRPQDWRSHTRPIIWPTNEELARRVGIKTSTLRYHLSHLHALGLIAYADGPNYQRRGTRSADGMIAQAYGIDLSPLAVRQAELAELAASTRAEAIERAQLRRRRTILRRDILSLLEDAKRRDLADFGQFAATLEHLNEQVAGELETLHSLVELYERLRSSVEDRYEEATNDCQNIASMVPNFRQQQSTGQPADSVSCKETENLNGACAPYHYAEAASGSKVAFDEKPCAGGASHQAEDDIRFLSLGLVRTALPRVAAEDDGAFASWTRLRASADRLALLAGINPQVLDEARATIGPDKAVVAVALTLEKHISGQVANPGAYLRRLVQRGGTGELHLSRSLFGLAERATQAVARATSTGLPRVKGRSRMPRSSSAGLME